MALADMYDAMISDRVYKRPIPHTEALSIIRDYRGGQLDPDIVDAFLLVQDQFARIAEVFDENCLQASKLAMKVRHSPR
jgi:HD-GYP domain-containing protein (c-di-GMP phosphodiesterase class II)